MKKIAVLWACISSVSVFAAVTPNTFECKLPDDILVVNYATTSEDGTPRLSAKFEGTEVFGNPGVAATWQVQPTVIGDLVTVGLKPAGQTGGATWTYSMMIPQIELGTQAAQVKFETILVVGETKPVSTPPGAQSRIENVFKIECVASFAMY